MFELQRGGHTATPFFMSSANAKRNAAKYTCSSCGCGEIGRRARFRFLWGHTHGGSIPLIRIESPTQVVGFFMRIHIGIAARPPVE